MSAARYHSIALLLAILLLSLTIHAQVSFFTPPTYAGSGNLFTADFNGDGKPDLLSSDGTLQLGKGDGTFTTGTRVSGTPLAVADFNGDGKPDVLEQGTGTLLVLLGNGDGTFQAAISTNSGASLQGLAATDLNGDGKADVVGVFNSSLVVYLGKGDGTFEPGVSYNLSASPAGNPSVVFGDFNGDSKIDIAVSVPFDNTPGEIAVFLGNGDGTFQTTQVVTPNVPGGVAAVGDFNGDGKLDLAVEGQDPSSPFMDMFWILLGNGDGTFQAPIAGFSFGGGPLAVVDLNGEGKLDLIADSFPFLEIYPGDGDGTFSVGHSYMTAIDNPGPRGLAVVDFNGDGKIDVAAGNDVLLGNGNGTLQGQPVAPVPAFAGGVTTPVLGDFNNDGVPDVAGITQSPTHGFPNVINILLNDGSGALILTNSYTIQQTVGLTSMVAADVNNDGNLDLVAIGATDGSNDWTLFVLLGNGNGSFAAPAVYALGTTQANGSVIAADFNNDHKVDLALPQDDGSAAIMLGNGDGTFQAPAFYYDASATTLLAADFNNDGNLDIAASTGVQTALLVGNGDGTFQAATILPEAFGALLAADLTNDGKVDLVGGMTQVLLGNGDGTFDVLPPFAGPIPGAVADLNGDGILDVIGLVGGQDSETGFVLGKGDGTFGPFYNVYQSIMNTGGVNCEAGADMNRDGRPDLICLAGGGSNSGVLVLINTTNKTTGDLGLIVPSGGSNLQTVQAGSKATYNLSIGGMGWSGQVTLSCAGAPTGATCSFPGGTNMNVSGGSASPFTVTVSTTASELASVTPPYPRNLAWMWAMELAAFVFLPGSLKVKRARLGAGMLTVLLVLLCSCGGGSGNGSRGGGGTSGGTPTGTYQLTVTATSGSIKASLPLKLIVQ